MKTKIEEITTRPQSHNAIVSRSSNSNSNSNSNSTNLSNTLKFNEGSFMARLKQMYEKRTLFKKKECFKLKHKRGDTPLAHSHSHSHNINGVKKIKSSQSTIDTDEDMMMKTQQFLIRNKSEKILVHPMFRQQQKYLTPKYTSSSSFSSHTNRIVHSVYLSPTSIGSSMRNSSSNNNNISSLSNNENKSSNTNIKDLLYKYVSLVLKKEKHDTSSQLSQSLYNISNNTNYKSRQLFHKEFITSYCNKTNNETAFIIDKQISTIFNKFPMHIRNQLTKMMKLQIHIKYCESMFDLINRKLDICDNINTPITSSKAVESKVYNEMIDFIYKHKAEYSLHKDFTIVKEITPEHVYMKSINEKYSKKNKVNVNNSNNNEHKRLYSSKDELRSTRDKRQRIEDIINKSMKEGKYKEKQLRDSTAKRLDYFARINGEYDYMKKSFMDKCMLNEDNNNNNETENTIVNMNKHKDNNNMDIVGSNVNEMFNSNITTQTFMKHLHDIHPSLSNNITIIHDDNNNSSTLINNQIHSNKFSSNSIFTTEKCTEQVTKETKLSDELKEKFKKELQIQFKLEEMEREAEKKRMEEAKRIQDELKQKEEKKKRVIERRKQLERQKKARQLLIKKIEHAEKKMKKKEKVETIINNIKNESNVIKRSNNYNENSLRMFKSFKSKSIMNDGSNNSLNSSYIKLKEDNITETSALRLVQEINCFLLVEQPKNENEKRLLDEFKEKINSLKMLSNEQYIAYINDNYQYLQNELNNLKKVKTFEKQINDFVFHLNYDRHNDAMHRTKLSDKIKFKDTIVYTQSKLNGLNKNV